MAAIQQTGYFGNGGVVYANAFGCVIILCSFKTRYNTIALIVVLWYMIFNSGIEASISGVLSFAMLVNSFAKTEKGIHKLAKPLFLFLPCFY